MMHLKKPKLQAVEVVRAWDVRDVSDQASTALCYGQDVGVG